MSINIKFLLCLVFLGDLLGHDKGEYLKIYKEGHPDHIEHKVVAENCQERFLEMD